MSQMLRGLLLDGALLRKHPLLSALKQSGTGHALYASLGADAQEVGPWLWMDKTLSDVEVLELPARHGISEIHCMAGLDDLLMHFAQIRHVETHDAQRYFLRYADMRAMRAVRAALDDAQWRFLVGPITLWAYPDRHGALQLIVDEAPAFERNGLNRLRLNMKQLNALMEASLADQLCLAVEELQEDGLHPDTDPSQYANVEVAARLYSAKTSSRSCSSVRSHARQSFWVQMRSNRQSFFRW